MHIVFDDMNQTLAKEADRDEIRSNNAMETLVALWQGEGRMCSYLVLLGNLGARMRTTWEIVVGTGVIKAHFDRIYVIEGHQPQPTRQKGQEKPNIEVVHRVKTSKDRHS